MKYSSSGSRVVPWGGTDSQTWISWRSLVAILRKAPETGITQLPLPTHDRRTRISAHKVIKVYPLQVSHFATGSISYCRVSADRLLACCCTLESPWRQGGSVICHQPVHVCGTSSVSPLAAERHIYMSYRTVNLQMLHFIYYSTNIRTEYFKHAAHSPFFFLFKMPFIS